MEYLRPERSERPVGYGGRACGLQEARGTRVNGSVPRLWHDRAGAKRRRHCFGITVGPGRLDRASGSSAQISRGRGSVPAAVARAVCGAAREASPGRCGNAGELDAAVPPVQLALGVGRGAPRNDDPLAPDGVGIVLAPEILARPAVDSSADSGPDLPNRGRKSVVGRGAHC